MRQPTTWGEKVAPRKQARRLAYKRFRNALISIYWGPSQTVELVEAAEALLQVIAIDSDQAKLLKKLLKQVGESKLNGCPFETGLDSEIQDSFELYSNWAHEARRA